MNEFIKPGDLEQKLRTAEAPLVLDVRSPEEFQAGHVPGALNIPLDDLADRMAELSKERPIVPYCNMRHRGNSRGERAAELLQAKGYEARAIDGGFVEWTSLGLPVQQA